MLIERLSKLILLAERLPSETQDRLAEAMEQVLAAPAPGHVRPEISQLIDETIRDSRGVLEYLRDR